MAVLRVLAPNDFDSEVLPPIPVLQADSSKAAHEFALHIKESITPQLSPPKLALVNVQILGAKTLTDKVSLIIAGRDYLTVGIEANSSLVRVLGVIRFKVLANSITATLQTRETFAVGRTIGLGLVNWFFPELNHNNRDESGRPKEGCGEIFGFFILMLVATVGFAVAGLVGAIVTFFVGGGAILYAVSVARQSKERQKEELLTLVKLVFANAYSEFKYAHTIESSSKQISPVKSALSVHCDVEGRVLID